MATSEYELLVVSQFTLYGRLKGNKPDFSRAMRPEPARALYTQLLDGLMKDHPGRVGAGEFGAKMEVALVNDGPVTLTLDTPH